MREPKMNSGVLFYNDNKTSDKSPAYRGNFYNDSDKFSISAWESGLSNTNYTTPGRGILFTNASKTEDNQPDMIGSITTPDSVRFYLSGWIRQSKEGNDYISLSIRSWVGQFNQVPDEHYSLGCQTWKDDRRG